MGEYRCGALRVTASRFELQALTDDGRVVAADLAISPPTAHMVRHLLAAHLDPVSGQRRRLLGRSLLERSLTLAGAALERVEVHAGDPPRFVLVIASPAGCLRRLDLDLVEVTDLVATRRVPVVAVGWPAADWDAALRDLLEG